MEGFPFKIFPIAVSKVTGRRMAKDNETTLINTFAITTIILMVSPVAFLSRGYGRKLKHVSRENQRPAKEVYCSYNRGHKTMFCGAIYIVSKGTVVGASHIRF